MRKGKLGPGPETLIWAGPNHLSGKNLGPRSLGAPHTPGLGHNLPEPKVAPEGLQ